MIRTNLRTVASVIAAQKEFKGSNMHGSNENYYLIPTGQLPQEYVEKLRDDIYTNEYVYIVYSFATPIGWVANGTWVVPDVKYSVTTTKQQGKLPAHGTIA